MSASERLGPDTAHALADSTGALLPWHDIAAYRQIDPGNARLRSLMADMIDTKAWCLLWVPPALPYYQLEGPFGAAPILLDLHHYPKAARDWLQQPKLAQIWAGDTESQENGTDDRTQWEAHVAEAQKLLQPQYALGRPPADLVEVLTLLALGGPGVLAQRALWRSVDRRKVPLSVRDKIKNLSIRGRAAQIAWHFRALYNLPEAITLLRGLPLRDIADEHPYWRRVLVYNMIGGLQAVLDEFTHVLCESLGLLDAPPEIVA